MIITDTDFWILIISNHKFMLEMTRPILTASQKHHNKHDNKVL